VKFLFPPFIRFKHSILASCVWNEISKQKLHPSNPSKPRQYVRALLLAMAVLWRAAELWTTFAVYGPSRAGPTLQARDHRWHHEREARVLQSRSKLAQQNVHSILAIGIATMSKWSQVHDRRLSARTPLSYTDSKA